MFQLQPRLQVEIEQRPGRTVLRVSGQLESRSAAAFKKTFRGLLGLTGQLLDVDLGQVTRMDGVGLASLVWAWSQAKGCGKELRVTRMRQPHRQLVEQMNLHQLLR